jgi:hypothetical protein
VEWNERVWDCLRDELFALKNDNWLYEGEAPVTIEEFRERATLEIIDVTPDGKFEFWHGDGFLFLDHAIVVGGSIETGVKSATLFG